MTTPADLIKGALLDIGVLGEDESPSASQTTDGLLYLSGLIDEWSNEGAPIFSNTAFIKVPTGATAYTFGDGGAWDSGSGVVPVEITGLRWGSTLNTLYDIQKIRYSDYTLLSDRNVTTDTQPLYYAVEYNNPSPLHTIAFYNVPTTGYLIMFALCRLTTGTLASTTVLSMPAAYYRALRLNLAVELMPQYGKMNQLVISLADKAKYEIIKRNMTNRPVRVDLGLPLLNTRGDILNG